MPHDEIYVSVVRTAGDLAGVFEDAEGTGYFYLYDQLQRAGQRVVAAIHILSGEHDFTESDVEVRWTQDEEIVGLLIRGRPWAAFRGEARLAGIIEPTIDRTFRTQ